MAKNYLQDGKTLTFIAKEDYKSGDMVQVGDCIVIALTDTPEGYAGTGLAEGVFSLPKDQNTDFEIGKPVYRLGKRVVNSKTEGAVKLGIAWETSESNAIVVAVKLG